jgi:hypothetical protein
MRVRSCNVWFTDRPGQKHSVKVEAASVYKAACKAWAIFKMTERTDTGEAYKTDDFVVDAGQKHVESILTSC